VSQLSHAQFPPRRHPNLLVDHRRNGSAAIADLRAANGENRDRLRWPASFRNSGRNQIGIPGRIESEFAPGCLRAISRRRFNYFSRGAEPALPSRSAAPRRRRPKRRGSRDRHGQDSRRGSAVADLLGRNRRPAAAVTHRCQCRVRAFGGNQRSLKNSRISAQTHVASAAGIIGEKGRLRTSEAIRSDSVLWLGP